MEGADRVPRPAALASAQAHVIWRVGLLGKADKNAASTPGISPKGEARQTLSKRPTARATYVYVE